MPLLLDDRQLAYAAGILDGEGCIRTTRNADATVVRVHVTNTDPRLVQRLKAWFGGYVWMDDKTYNPRAKPRYVWEVSAVQATVVLQAVLPFLLLKREQAEIALAIQATRQHTRTRERDSKGRLVTLSADIRAERQHLVGRLRALNKKGVA